MYSISRLTHERYGSIVQIKRMDFGTYQTPFQAVNAAIKERQELLDTGIKKVRILVDEQVMYPNQARHWANDEYRTIPKCIGCSNILNDDIHNHQLSPNRLFCSVVCADKDYFEEVEKRKDEEEIEFR